MPKKRTGKALLIKPGSQAATLTSAKQNGESSRPSVNDLIRESRRLQLRDQSVSSSSPIPSSVPPQLRDVLNLPAPVAPHARPGIRRLRPTPIPTSERGPSRVRTVPGPPPPKSWLIDSRHAPAAVFQDEYQSMRRLDEPLVLPGAHFPRVGSLLDQTLKELAINWEWHVPYDGMWLRDIPVKMREALLSYIAIYNDQVESNPVRMLFLAPTDTGDTTGSCDYNDITRLDLSDGIGNWTRVKQLERDLVPKSTAEPDAERKTAAVPESWDAESISPTASMRIGLITPNLKHLSLALSHSSSIVGSQTVSWKQLLQLSSHLSGLESLSLAHWPHPTFTPIAAKTRATITLGQGSSPRAIFGGTSMYSRLDNDFRESAGILRTLSQRLRSLTWLDLTGCGEWWEALYWEAPEHSSESDGEFSGTNELQNEADEQHVASRSARTCPDWNGAWRSIVHVGLKIGYTPLESEDPHDYIDSVLKSGQQVRRQAIVDKEKRIWAELKERQATAVRSLREIRRRSSGKWLNFEL